MEDKKHKILMLEDELDLADIYGLKLKEFFYLEIISSGKGALEMIKKIRPDFVLLDLMMPEVDGFEVLVQVRKDKDVKNTLIYAWSNFTQKKELEQAKKVGADGYLIKSDYTPSSLLEKVKEILKIK
ncbi:MAG: response regulator [bacterium]